MTSRPHRATGAPCLRDAPPAHLREVPLARLREAPLARLRATVLAVGLVLGPFAVLMALAPAASAQQSTFAPGQGTAPQDADRAAAIEGQRRTIDDHREAAREAADATGMPQLDFSNPLTISQVVWLFVIFGLFVFLCAQYLLPPVAEVLADRRTRVGADLDAARAAKSDADAAASAHREATERARAEAQAAIAGAVQAATADANARAAVLNARLGEQIAAAETRIARARDAAMGALREVSVDATGALVERLAGIRDAAAVTAAVDRALAARTVAAGGRS